MAARRNGSGKKSENKRVRVWERDMYGRVHLLFSFHRCLFYSGILPSPVTLHQHHHNCLVPSLFLPLSLCFSSPPFSSLLLFLTHTLPHWGCLNRWKSWSASTESLVCFWAEPNRRVRSYCKPGPALLSKHWRSHHEKAKPCFPGRRFPTAWGHLPRVVKTGMLLQGCDDSGSYPVMHLRNVKLQIQTFLVQW